MKLAEAKEEPAEEPAEGEPKKPERTFPHVVRLRCPVEWAKGQPIGELTFRQGRAGDTKGIDLAKITTDALMLIASRMASQPIGVIERLEGADAGEAIGIARDFLTQFLAT